MDIKEVLKGQNDVIILYILSSGDRHIDELKEIIDNLFNGIKIGTLYSVITRLKTQQFINEYRASSLNGSRRKYFKITDAGKKEFNEKYASLFTENVELPVRDEITQETFVQPTKRTSKTTKKQEISTQIEEETDVLDQTTQKTDDESDYSSYIHSASMQTTVTDIDFSSLDDESDDKTVDETPITTQKVSDTFTVDDYNLKKDMEKEDEIDKIGVKKPTDDTIGSTVYQYGQVLNELFPKNVTTDTTTQDQTPTQTDKQGDLTDVYELAEKDGIKIRTSADTNRYQGSKILLNTLLLHTSVIWFAVYVVMFLISSLICLKIVDFNLLIKSSLILAIVPIMFLVIFLINPKYSVKDLFRFKNVIEIALTLTITTIIIVIAVANLMNLDYLNNQVLFTSVVFPIIIAISLPIFFIIEYLLVKLNFYQTL